MANDVSYFQIEGNPTTYSFNDADAETKITQKVSKSGDTMTGGLIVTNNTPVTLQDTGMTIGTNPTSVHYGAGLVLADSAGTKFAYARHMYFEDGRLGINIATYRMVSGASRGNALGLLVEADGTPNVYLSAPSAWITALGAVPTSRTINGKALTGNITLTASDVGALASTDGTVLHIGAAGTRTDGTLALPTSPTGTNATHVFTFSLPSGASLYGVSIISSTSNAAIVSWGISQANGTATIRAYNLSSSATVTWSSISVRPLYIL